MDKSERERLIECMTVDKNLTQESSLQQLRDQVKELDGEYRQLRAQFEEKEKQQNDAFNVSWKTVWIYTSMYADEIHIAILSCHNDDKTEGQHT